jgi:AAHS family 4-hydroxybenzoate transporter-like MFS transporter
MSAAPAGQENRVAALCAGVLVLEGFDLGAMAFTLPALSEAWQLKPVAFTAALTAGSVGLFLGSLICGWLGDRLGRKPVLMGCVALFGLMSLATAFATDPGTLTLARFLTGLGIGGGIPASIALLSDFAPARRQGGLVMAMTCGVQTGNVLGGILAAHLLKPFGWPAVFVVGGIIPLLLLPLLFAMLPESPSFLARRAAPQRAEKKNSIAALFAPSLARITLLLWLINFLSLLTIYFINSWLPSMLRTLGLPTATAILAATMFQVGGIAGGLGSGRLVNRYGTEKIVSGLLVVGAACLILLSMAGPSVTVLIALIFGMGVGISAGQLGINALPGAIYPPAIRNTGAGWSLGIGRLGNIGGPLFGGLLLALGWTPQNMLLAISVPALALAAMLLVLARARREMPAA